MTDIPDTAGHTSQYVQNDLLPFHFSCNTMSTVSLVGCKYTLKYVHTAYLHSPYPFPCESVFCFPTCAVHVHVTPFSLSNNKCMGTCWVPLTCVLSEQQFREKGQEKSYREIPELHIYGSHH